MRIQDVKIEGLSNHCVTDRYPRISFSLDSDLQEEDLNKAVITIGNWKKETTDQINNLYDGPLNPFTLYQVHIHAIGTSGEQADAETTFETGRLNIPWQAKWITDGSYEYPDKASPVPMTFQKEFKLTKNIRRAFVNATALGIYELLLNGRKVGKDYFSPGFTSYDHQMQYQTYDVTEMLESSNLLTVVVAGGWAAGSFNHKRVSKISADRQAFLMELYVEYEDGSFNVICSDESWQVTEEGNYRMAEFYDGETYDATVDMTSVNWKSVTLTKPRKNPKLFAEYGCPVRVHEILSPVGCTRSPEGELIYDFGQNFAGVICAQINGARGQKVIFRHAEVLSDGNLFVKSLRTAKATATYICRAGAQKYSPCLTYMGFRYVGISGIEANNLVLSAFVLHSDFEEIGTFECSNELINRLNQNIRWGGKSNFVDIPTDCPQRDERQGWTGDLAVFASTACFNFNTSRFFEKWLMDLQAEQGKGGGIPMVIPRAGDSWPVMATSCWGDSCILVPWAEYLARGDIEMLRRQYPSMKKFLAAAKWWSSFLSITPNNRYIWRLLFHWGDWCAPGEGAKDWILKGKWIATAYFANSCGIAAQIAEILGYKDDVLYFDTLRNKIEKAYRKVFTNGKGKLKKEFQTAYVLPLYFKMTHGDETKKMAENLARLVKEADYHLNTGFTGTPYLLFALSDNGHVDDAYRILLQDTCPSWLYEVKAGGTTIWERWDALRPDGTINIEDLNSHKEGEASNGGMVSFNHYANGAVGDWLYRRISGIEATSGGYRTFRIAPVLGGELTFAKGSIHTSYGQITSDWKIENDIFTIMVDVPVSTNCLLCLPNNDRHNLKSGHYTFSCSM